MRVRVDAPLLRRLRPRSGGVRVTVTLPRFVHRWYARLFGYFWLPCPRCGRWFGGHEEGGGIDVTEQSALTDRYRWQTGRGTCPQCPGNLWVGEGKPQWWVYRVSSAQEYADAKRDFDAELARPDSARPGEGDTE